MDSIDKNSPEDNFRNLIGEEGIAKMKELARSAGSCFFCTRLDGTGKFNTRPMSADGIDDRGDFWFLSPSDSHKNQDIAIDPRVQLLFQGSAHSDFMTLSGRATVSRDQTKIKELWNPFLKVWFTEGENDPRITTIKFTPDDGHYWDTKHGEGIALVKRLYGAAVGKTYDDSVEGKITP